MKLPKELTTVTKTSKILAFVVFITLPFLGFFLGMNYQSSLDSASQAPTTDPILPKRISTPTPSQAINTSTWKTYTNTKYYYSVKFSSAYKINDNKDTSIMKGAEASLLIVPQDDRGPVLPIFWINVLSENGLRTPETAISYNVDGFTDNVKQYISVPVGTIVSPPNGSKFTRLSDGYVDGKKAVIFEGIPYRDGKPLANATKDRRLIITKNNNIYLIGTYYDDDKSTNWYNFNQILSTFKFLP